MGIFDAFLNIDSNQDGRQEAEENKHEQLKADSLITHCYYFIDLIDKNPLDSAIYVEYNHIKDKLKLLEKQALECRGYKFYISHGELEIKEV